MHVLMNNPVPNGRFLAAVLGWATLSLAAALEAHAQLPQGACIARETARQRLLVEGGRELYVEPSVLVVSGGQALLAGQPTYLFSPQRRAGGAELQGNGVVFGALVDADGRGRSVPLPPVPGRVSAALAALARQDGGWHVIFAELDSSPPVLDRPAKSYWYGVFDGHRWSSLQRLPDPQGVSLAQLNNSEMIEFGDTLMWAARVQTPHSVAVAVFQRTSSGWASEVLVTPSVAYVTLSHTPSLGPVLGIVHPDITLPSDGNSLFFYERRSSWRILRKVVSSADHAVHFPLLRLSDQGGFLTWEKAAIMVGPGALGVAADPGVTAGELPPAHLYAMAGQLVTRSEPVSLVDDNLAESWDVATLANGNRLWVTDHVASWSGTTPHRELRLIAHEDGKSSVLWKSAHPYQGPFAAVALGDSTVLVAGPKLEEARGVLVSLLIRVRVNCASIAAR